MPDVIEYDIDPPVLKWGSSLLTERVSVLNDSPITFNVSAYRNGLPYDPRSSAGSVAFMTNDVDPVSGNWVAADWDVTLIGGYVLEVSTGASGAALATGTYYAWVRIVDSATNTTFITPCGQLIVQ